MSLKIKPLEDRVVVEAMAADETTASGSILPDTAQEKPQQGTVVGVGKGKNNEDGTTSKMTVKAGDVVLYGKYSGTEITNEGKHLLIMRESDILAIL